MHIFHFGRCVRVCRYVCVCVAWMAHKYAYGIWWEKTTKQINSIISLSNSTNLLIDTQLYLSFIVCFGRFFIFQFSFLLHSLILWRFQHYLYERIHTHTHTHTCLHTNTPNLFYIYVYKFSYYFIIFNTVVQHLLSLFLFLLIFFLLSMPLHRRCNNLYRLKRNTIL